MRCLVNVSRTWTTCRQAPTTSIMARNSRSGELERFEQHCTRSRPAILRLIVASHTRRLSASPVRILIARKNRPLDHGLAVTHRPVCAPHHLWDLGLCGIRMCRLKQAGMPFKPPRFPATGTAALNAGRTLTLSPERENTGHSIAYDYVL